MRRLASAALVGRWIARIAGTLVLLILVAFAVGEGIPGPSDLRAREMVIFAGLGVMALGLAISWIRPRLGGLLVMAGCAVMYAGLRGSLIRAIAFCAGIGVLHVVCDWILRRQPPLAPRAGDRRRVWAVVPWAMLGILVLLVANEVLMITPFMSPRLRTAGPLSGTWRSGDIVFTIHPDGSVSGNYGKAAVKGRIVCNRSWFGRLMNWRNDYCIHGELIGDGLIARTPGFSAPLNIRNGVMEGGIFLTGRSAKAGPYRLQLKRD